MSDLIDRQAAIDEWKNDFKGYVNALDLPRDDYKGIMAYIEEVPSAKPKPRWIPVSERLPGKHRSAIVTDFCHVTLAYTNNLDEWMDYDRNKLKNVTAWMPLPEPYRKETEDD